MKTTRILLVIFLVFLTACSVMPNHKDSFTKKNEDFMLRVRWLDFLGASLHFEGDHLADFVERFADKEELKITDFSMVRMDVVAPDEKIIAHYRLDYYLLPSATIVKKRFSLTWESKPAEGLKMSYWRITEDFPEID